MKIAKLYELHFSPARMVTPSLAKTKAKQKFRVSGKPEWGILASSGEQSRIVANSDE